MKVYLPVLFWALFIFVLTMMPGRYIPPVSVWDFISFDKLGHFSLFLILMILALHGIVKQAQSVTTSFKILFAAFLACTAYGFLLEVLQDTLSADRHFDLLDALANSIGSLIGGLLFKFLLQAIIAMRFRSYC